MLRLSVANEWKKFWSNPMASKKKALRVTLIKSKFGRKAGHLECVRGLGLTRRQQTVEVEDTPAIRGLITKVAYLLKVEETSHAS